jgi:hypothetical protein
VSLVRGLTVGASWTISRWKSEGQILYLMRVVPCSRADGKNKGGERLHLCDEGDVCLDPKLGEDLRLFSCDGVKKDAAELSGSLLGVTTIQNA